MNRADSTPEQAPLATEEIIAHVFEALGQRPHRTAGLEAEDRLITTFVRMVSQGLPGYDAKTVGEIAVHLAWELFDVAASLTGTDHRPEQAGAIVANVAAIAGVRLYRAAELGADWITS
jgi:hypothetical protein